MQYLPDNKYTLRPKTDQIAVHCSETPASDNIDVDIIRKWHTDPVPEGRGWIDVGYHFVIKRDGTIQPGRPVWALPAAVTGENYHILAICLVGGSDEHDKEQNNFTPEQFESLKTLIQGLMQKYPDIEQNPQPVLGHRDYASGKAEGKFCPSFDAAPWWKSVDV